MLHLLDANVLIDANRDYYPITRVPEFWEWLLHLGEQGQVKIPIEVYEEVTIGDDDLTQWAKTDSVKSELLLPEEAEVPLVSLVINDGYAPDLTDDEVEKVGRDPFLIAYALDHRDSRCIVTTEVSKPKKTRANRRIPDVCHVLEITSMHTFEMLRQLNFTTDWK